jgi:hypothetical protein
MRALRVFACATLLIALPRTVEGQLSAASRVAIGSEEHARDITGADTPVADRKVPSSLTVTLASALVPGAGQLLLKQRRAAAYLALEAAGLAFYMSQTRDGRRQRNRYREIASTVARAPFTPDGPRGNWDYYERMEKFVASGNYDVVSGGALDPETDEETYNGTVWLLARETYWRDADVPPDAGSTEYAAAIAFYVQRAVPTEMRWSWAGQPDAYQRFRAAISGSNSAFRSAGHTASLVIANHFLSAVDAYVSVRVRVRRTADGSLAVTGALPIRY